MGSVQGTGGWLSGKRSFTLPEVLIGPDRASDFEVTAFPPLTNAASRRQACLAPGEARWALFVCGARLGL